MTAATKNMEKVANAEPIIRSARVGDLGEVRELAEKSWRRHYPGIISHAQIDYMLAQRYSEDALREQIEGRDRWFDLLTVCGRTVGFANYLRTTQADEMKLDKLYLDQEYQGRGLGRLMIEHVCAACRKLGMKRLVLAVNKHNTSAIVVYERNGFAVRDAVKVDIGGGFFMDDYIMVKPL